MNVVVDRFRGWEFSPFPASGRRGQVDTAAPPLTQTFLERLASSGPRTPWIVESSRIAASGRIQAGVLAVSIIFVVVHLVRRINAGQERIVKSKAAAVKWRYEIVAQVSRAAALCFLALAASEGRAHPLNAVLVAYAFVLGLTRLAGGLTWRRLALYQVNFALSAELVVLAVAQLLPCIEVDGVCVQHASVIGGSAAVAAAVLTAASTPVEWSPPDLGYDIPGFVIPEEPAPEEAASWVSYYITFQWLTPTIWRGTWGKLDLTGIPGLAWYDEPVYLLRQVQKAREISKSTFWTTMRFQRTELCLMAFWISLCYVVENVAPFGMFRLLAYLDDQMSAEYQPWVWLMLTFLGPLIRSVFFAQYVFTSTRLIVRAKSAMTQELYHRALASMELEDDPFSSKFDDPDDKKADQDKQNKSKSTSAGRLANLMSADLEALFRGRDIMIVLAGVPAGTIISFIGLYRMLGWASIVGMVVLVLATPISVFFGKLMFRTQKRVRKAQDSRISLVAEYLGSIKAIKYFAWEDAITNKIAEARSSEQKGLWNMSVLQVLINQVTQAFPYLSLLVMFAIHVTIDGQRLTASTAFTTVFLVRNVRRNVMMASFFVRGFAGAVVAFGRLDKYFASTVPVVVHPEGPLRIQNGFFRRNKKATFRLEDISLDFVEGGLNAVTGQSGSGKSTLLLAILGETYVEGGSVTAPADIAYASQSSWLQNLTIENNILFGSTMERERYDRVLEACCLPEDLRELAEGDQTSVGENGTSLSGGQKARVALARALYSKAPLLLLDDIFSALDAKTSAGVWKHCFCSDLLKGRTVVLVTQVPWISTQADLAVLMDRGRVKSAEPNIGVVRTPIKIADVLGGGDDAEGSETEVGSQSITPPEPSLQAKSDALNETAKVAQAIPLQRIIDQESQASGKVSRMTIFHYMGYFGHPTFAISCLVGLFVANVCYFGANFWLGIWVEAADRDENISVSYYLGVFASFIFVELFAYGFIVIVFEWGGWRAARRLHNDFVRAIMRVPLAWFKVVPIGRITNRFSGDMASIDNVLPSMVRQTLDLFMMIFFRLGAVSAIMPIFMIPGIVTCFLGVLIGEMYMRTAVIIKRFTSSAQSPVFSQFADTLAGLAVIRARSDKSQQFGFELADKLRIWTASAEANYNCNRWVGIRIDFVTSLVSLFAGVIAIAKAGTVGAGLVGFSLTNANDLSQTVLYMVRSMNELEVEMQSFHRVKEYVKLEAEEKDDEVYPDAEDDVAVDEEHVIPKNWPRSGDVEFRDVTIRYDPDGPDILTDVNLKFKAGERVAVVGRTGSGKSTLVLSLLRFTDIVKGQILFDGVDITKLPRQRLRESLTIIPQEAVLFNGSVETNLDPSGSVPKDRLEKALDSCKGIASFSGNVTEDEDEEVADPAIRGHAQAITLSTEVEARGENFSHGQRQVLSLCRALIRKSKLMLLDEATASMDYETDRGIQQVLRKDLESADDARTLVTIAHRLRTIIDYDSVVVMNAGRVLEYGSPKELYDAKGQFYDMIYHSGEMEDLQQLLEEK